jgi:hypothetical protein
MSGTIPPVVPPLTFDYAAWLARFPEFAAVPQGMAQAYWYEAGIICDNTPTSPITDMTQLGVLLNLLTAHIATLNGGLTAAGVTTGGAGLGLTGRISSATEGSVSVSSEFPITGDGPNAAWYSQTPYGAAYWAMTAQYRTWRYYVGPQQFREPLLGPWGQPWGHRF